MPKRIHIRGAQVVTMDEALGDFAVGRHPDRGRRHPCRRAVARRGGAETDRRRRHDRAARHHRCPHLPVADGAARLRARPVAGRLLLEVPAAAQPLHRRRQLQCRLCRRLRNAVLRHDHRRRLLPRHQRARLRPRLDRGAEGNRHPSPLHLFLHAVSRRTEFRGRRIAWPTDGCVYDKFHDPAGLTTIGFGVEFHRRAGAWRSSSPSRAT